MDKQDTDLIDEEELRRMFADNKLKTTRECNACNGNGCSYCDGVGLVDNEYGYFVKDIIAKFGKPSGGGVVVMRQLVDLCKVQGDFSNGNVFNGVDEGVVNASKIIERAEQALTPKEEKNNG